MATGLKEALRLSCMAGGLYLAFVLMTILLEVHTFGASFGSIAFYSLTALFAVATILIHWRTVSRKPLALLSAMTFVFFTCALAVVAGVNAKFWMGGAL